ncbi:MAG: helix-turn-helix transcriptional regulator [Actinomycetota bacterium]
MSERLDTAAAPVGALEDELRRRMYLLIRRSGRPLSREEVADELGISRKLAAFHLDKLLQKGLLTAHYARPPGRSGPGAGRPAKLYRPSDLEVEVSIPERRYDLAGTLMVKAIKKQRPEESAPSAATRVSREAGEDVGREIRRSKRLRPPGPERTLAIAQEVLESYGFEPYRTPSGELALRNCPFHALAQQAPDLVCEMNQAWVKGVVRGLGNETVEAALDPRPGECCVRLRRSEVSR